MTSLNLLLSLIVVSANPATGPTAEEMGRAGRFVTARFAAAPPAGVKEPGLVVVANHDPVTTNARGAKPLHVAGKEYTRGLYCHAQSKVIVRLPGKGKTLDAVVGVDSNDQTRPGRGSIIFSVHVGDREAFRSDVIHEGMAGVPVSADLGGAAEFVLEVGDSGDGISCDQADWADARVTLADGTVVWLGELPILGSGAGLLETGPPFSFTYGGRPSAELLPGWEAKRSARKLDDQRTEHTVVYTDAETGLAVRYVAIEYHDFPTVEWTLHFKNDGAADTPILENIQALDLGFERGESGEFLLHHNAGSQCSQADFRPLATPLGPNATKRIGGAGGRPTNSDLSYFNVEWPDAGLIVAVGWPGQWAAELVRDGSRGLVVRAGQELTHFKLLPGEEVRTPLAVLQFWQGGDWLRAQNVWRRWVMAHGMTRPGGQLPPAAFRASSSRAYEEMIGANEQNQIMHIDRYVEEDLGLNTWWMDAGWYVQERGWPQVGTWEVDPKRFPHGFKPISDHAHAKGINILVWFEPERVAAGTWLAENHPEWILGGRQGGLLNLGNPEAWHWLVEHVDTLLTEQGIDVYRQDFNMDPLGLWRGADAPDRQGITEIRHVTGLLAYWDELRRRHPGLLIDTCASGGRRIDLETLRRAVPLWRSDYAFEPIGHQGMTYGLSTWIPYHGTGTVAYAGAGYYGGGPTPIQPYAFWSNAAPSLGSGIDIRERGIDYAALRRLLDQWRQISPCYYGDFYPLTPYSLEASDWIAWQFDRPESGEGVVQAFRREESPFVAAKFPLRGLDADADYEVTRLGSSEPPEQMAGRALAEEGLPVRMADRPEAAVIVYRRVQ